MKERKLKRRKNKKFKRQECSQGPSILKILDMAIQHHQEGRLKLAEEGYCHVLELDPGHAGAYNNLGVLLQNQHSLQEALKMYRRALAVKPRYPEALNNLGIVYKELGRYDESLNCHQEAYRIRADDVLTLNNLGTIHFYRREMKEAVDFYRQAYALNPHDVSTLYNLANTLEKNNQVSEAKLIVMQGLEVAPHHTDLNVLLSRCDRRQGNIRSAIDRLERIDRQALELKTYRELCFELGLLYDRSGLYEHAFQMFSDGNIGAKKEFRDKGDNQRYLELIDQLTRLFDGPISLPDTDQTVMPTAPVFLVGFPRSGTTLLDQILDSHPRVQTIEEKEIINPLIKRLTANYPNYLEAWNLISNQALAEARSEYFSIAGRYVNHQIGSILIDKFPLNIIYTGFIWRLFPNTKFILAIRHPYDVCLSCFMQDFIINDAMANFFTLEGSSKLYAKTMYLWKQYISRLPIKYHMVRYEDLVSNFQGELKKIFDFLELPWDDAVLSFATHARERGGIFTPSYHQVSEGIYQRAKYRWHNYAGQIKTIARILAPYVEDLGYDVLPPA